MKTKSNSKNENVVRELYRTAEVQDPKAFVSLFTEGVTSGMCRRELNIMGRTLGRPLIFMPVLSRYASRALAGFCQGR